MKPEPSTGLYATYPGYGDAFGWHERATPPLGSIGYTGSYREPSADVVEVSVVSVLEARGPD